jgi:hypothetical protein
VAQTPQPDDPYANALISEPLECRRMIHDRQGQATHYPWQGVSFKAVLTEGGAEFGCRC